MPNIVLSRADQWPVGTSVSLYPAGSAPNGGRPRAAAVETQTVQANGTVTFTSAVADTPYVASAYLNSVSKNVRCQVSAFAPRTPATWQGVVAARRTAIGTS